MARSVSRMGPEARRILEERVVDYVRKNPKPVPDVAEYFDVNAKWVRKVLKRNGIKLPKGEWPTLAKLKPVPGSRRDFPERKKDGLA